MELQDLPEIRHLWYFIAVAEALNFTHAAESLHMTQPPLSQQIQALEAKLGIQLFDRKKRPLGLTLAGQTFLEEARLVLSQLERAMLSAQQTASGKRGRLTVGFNSSIANSVLPAILRTFQARFPNVKLVWRELSTSWQIQELRDRQIDVGLFHTLDEAVADSDLSFMTLMQEPLIVALPEAHPMVSQPQVSLQALSEDTFVLPIRQLVPGLLEQIYHLCSQAGFVPKSNQEATLMLTILGLVAGGVGVAVLPANAQNLQRRGVIYKPIDGQTATVQMAMAWRPNDSSVIVDQFLEVAKNICSELQTETLKTANSVY